MDLTCVALQCRPPAEHGRLPGGPAAGYLCQHQPQVRLPAPARQCHRPHHRGGLQLLLMFSKILTCISPDTGHHCHGLAKSKSSCIHRGWGARNISKFTDRRKIERECSSSKCSAGLLLILALDESEESTNRKQEGCSSNVCDQTSSSGSCPMCLDLPCADVNITHLVRPDAPVVIPFSCQKVRCVLQTSCSKRLPQTHSLLDSPDPSKTQSNVGTVLSTYTAPRQPGPGAEPAGASTRSIG